MAAIVNEKNDLPKDRYFYVFLTEKLDVGYISNHTPQHITLVPPFCGDEKTVLKVAKNTASQYTPFNIRLIGRTNIGDEANISVILVVPNEKLHQLHIALFDELESHGINTGYTRYIRDEFTPHITLKKYLPKIDETQTLKVDHIAVFHKHKNIKKIIAKYSLGARGES